MSKEAFEKIAEGLREALSVARGLPNPDSQENLALAVIDEAVRASSLTPDRQIGVLAMAIILAARRLAPRNAHQRATLFRKIGQGITDRLRQFCND